MNASSVRFCIASIVGLAACGCGHISHSQNDDGPLQSVMGKPTPVASSTGSVDSGGNGYRVSLTHDGATVPVVVVSGTPHEMGFHLGKLLRQDIQDFVPRAASRMIEETGLSTERLAEVWQTTSPHVDKRLKQEMRGLAEGSEVPLAVLQQLHCLPLLMPYSCSSIAAWGTATRDGHLYQTRNLDWDMSVGAHDVPAVVIYRPNHGLVHVVPGFAGFIGAHCGMNAAGIVLSEMGDSPDNEMPYKLQAPHFTAWFRRLLYDTHSLRETLDVFATVPMTKRYHFVFGDGLGNRHAVKIRAHAPEPPDQRVQIWHDNDPKDELAPNVLPHIVYQDEGRGAFPILQAQHGQLNPASMVKLCNHLPIEGSNVMNAVFDATKQRLWVSYAKENVEAYRRPYVLIDCTRFDTKKVRPASRR